MIDLNRDHEASPQRTRATPFVLHRGEGFHLLAPKGATQNDASDHGRWRYHDFLFRMSPDETAESTGAFYYWTRNLPAELDVPRVRSLCREVIRRHLFEGAFRLRMHEALEGVVGSKPSMVLKLRFSMAEPKWSGPMNLYTLHDTARSWFFVLGVFTEQAGDSAREEAVLELLEHKIVLSLHLER